MVKSRAGIALGLRRLSADRATAEETPCLPRHSRALLALARRRRRAAWRPACIDIAYACIFWAIKAGVRPSRIFQSVAAGLLGRPAAVAGGASTAALGLALHFFIALTVAVVYYTGARYAEALWRRPWTFGSLYGVAVFGVMHYVVVPLSAAGGGGIAPFDLLWDGLSIVVHAFGIGVPVALAARAALRGRTERPPTVGSASAARASSPRPASFGRRSLPAGGRLSPWTRAAWRPSGFCVALNLFETGVRFRAGRRFVGRIRT